MVAISLYKGNLHQSPDLFRQWLMPAPTISLKSFKTLLHRRSRALTRLLSSNDTISNPNPNWDHSGREHQPAGYLEDIANVASPLNVGVENLVGELANANDDDSVKEGSMAVDDFLAVDQPRARKRKGRKKLKKTLSERRHKLGIQVPKYLKWRLWQL